MVLNHTPLFPFDPAIDSALEHRHLIFAYVVVLVGQIVYISYLVRQFLVAGRTRSRRGPDGIEKGYSSLAVVR
jgi:hypothetical protein